MANKHMKKYLTLLIIKAMQIRETMKYHFTLTRVAIRKKLDNNKGWWGCREIGTLIHYWWGCKYGITLENSVAFPQNVKYRVTIWLSNSTSTHITMRNKTQKNSYIQMYINSIIYNCQKIETNQMFVN